MPCTAGSAECWFQIKVPLQVCLLCGGLLAAHTHSRCLSLPCTPQSNFATVDDDTSIVTTRRADRHFEVEGPILSRHLDCMAIPGFPQHQVSVKCVGARQMGCRTTCNVLVCQCHVTHSLYFISDKQALNCM